MTVQELIEKLQSVERTDSVVTDDEGRTVVRIESDGTLVFDRRED